MLAPVAQGGGGPGPEDLGLLPEPVQRVAGDEEPQHLLLLGETLRLRPGGGLGQGRVGGLVGGQLPEQRPLARGAVGLPELRLPQALVQGRRQLAAVAPHLVERARGDQRFHDALVAEPQVDPLAEVGQGVVRIAVRPGR